MSIVTDDLLLEILVRLPSAKAVIQCSLVCKRWFSLVSHSAYFIEKFNHHHRHKRLQHSGPKYSDTTSDEDYSRLPYTLVNIRDFAGRKSPYICGEALPSHILFHNPSSSLRTTVLASFQDLLLIERSNIPRQCFYLLNPQTRQHVALPPAPANTVTRAFRCGIVCESNCGCDKQLGQGSYYYYCNRSINYRVVLITMDDKENSNSNSNSNSSLHAAIFRSETGRWSELVFQFPVRMNIWQLRSVGSASNGVIYWPFGLNQTLGIVAFDTGFKGGRDYHDSQRCRLISLPEEYDRGLRSSTNERAQLGVVRGRLRLSHLFLSERNNSFVLKAWELEETSSSWNLVHHVSLKRRNRSMFLSLIALHPEDGNAFFLKREDGGDIDICQYKIRRRDNYEHVCKFLDCTLCVFPLVHLWWPTIIPSLPCMRECYYNFYSPSTWIHPNSIFYY